MAVYTELNPKARKQIEDILARKDFDNEKDPYRTEYPYRPTLDVFVTDQYTAKGAWAHTEPDRKVVCIRPHERLGYDLFLENPWAANIPFGIVAIHEVSHNAYPGASEGAIRSITSQPDARYVLDGFNLKYHGRN